MTIEKTTTADVYLFSPRRDDDDDDDDNDGYNDDVDSDDDDDVKSFHVNPRRYLRYFQWGKKREERGKGGRRKG